MAVANFDFPVEAFREGLRRASVDVQTEIVDLLTRSARATQHGVQQAYPLGPTGRLRGQVYLSQPRSFGSSAYGVPIPVLQVRATAPHVHIYQHGTKKRSDATRGGADRGISPPHGPIFERISATNRTQFFVQSQHILDRPREIA